MEIEEGYPSHSSPVHYGLPPYYSMPNTPMKPSSPSGLKRKGSHSPEHWSSSKRFAGTTSSFLSAKRLSCSADFPSRFHPYTPNSNANSNHQIHHPSSSPFSGNLHDYNHNQSLSKSLHQQTNQDFMNLNTCHNDVNVEQDDGKTHLETQPRNNTEIDEVTETQTQSINSSLQSSSSNPSLKSKPQHKLKPRYTIGYRADCEKCVKGVPNHFAHITFQ